MGCLDPSGGRKLFAALRQVGKANYLLPFTDVHLEIMCFSSGEYILTLECFFWQNFEKITSVSRAKTRIRLGIITIGLWSLLKSTAVKPLSHSETSRFKIFIETLENQLLKDRKKNIKKRLSSGENNSPIPNIPSSNQVRAPGHDNRAVKMVLVDSQNVQKSWNWKRSFVQAPCKYGRLVSTAAYKRWEKAAIAGVSLVADAAEHLERSHDGSQLVGEAAHSLQTFSQSKFNENNNHSSTKLKLQLFPIDECTQKALERDHHNPHLELTLSTRKENIICIGTSKSQMGKLKFSRSRVNAFSLLGTEGKPGWVSEVDEGLYSLCSRCALPNWKPSNFPPQILFPISRYGWFSKAEVESATAQALSCAHINEQNLNINTATEQNAETVNPSAPPVMTSLSLQNKLSLWLPHPHLRQLRQLSVVSLFPTSIIQDIMIAQQKEMAFSAGEWADSLTNISMGDLLSESTHNVDANCAEFPVPLGSNYLQQNPFSCDSFDAAIAAHIYKHQNKVDLQQHVPSSIWDAEETCDAFVFQKTSAFCDKDPNAYMNDSVEVCKQANMTSPSVSDNEVQELSEVEKLTNSERNCGDLVGDCRSDHPTENSGLTDIYWPDSLGPLDLDIPSCRYHNNDLILSDSLGGLNRLIANSLDAFQSCSFFGLDKKESASTSEARQNAPFSDFKIGSEV
ncbi:hypothetical protein DH2020_040092 [Rehmannia glutinosa]|uniref:Uncharacterized protein n=1 Tax=Rehmannia glutinosa TaxID=99300 RepID=A0ABR0UTZ5_REHGL